MADRTIDIIIRTRDETARGLSAIQSKFAALENKIKSAANRIKSFAGAKYRASISLIDRVTPEGSKINAVLKSFAGKSYRATVSITDSASSKLQSLNANLARLTAKSYSIAVNVKDNASKKLSGLTDGLLMGTGAMTGMLGTMGVGFGVANAIKSYAAFEKQMSAVQAIRQLDKNSPEMQALTQQAKDLGAQTAFTREEVGQAQYYQGLAGWSTQEILSGTPHMLNLAAAGNVDLKSASDITTDAMTAFGLKASDKFTNAMGEQINATKYFVDMFAKLQASSNTDILQAGEAFKYSAATIGAMFADVQGQEGVQMRTEAARQAMIMTGLLANAGIKGSTAGTGINTLFNRLAGGNGNTAFAERLLGLEHAVDGRMLMPLDYVKGFQKRAKEGMSVDDFYSVAEELSGEKINAQTRRQLDSVIEHGLKNGGKLGSEDIIKLSKMMAGMENAPKLMAMLFQDIDALEASMTNVEGTAQGMADTQLDNLAGDFVKLSSAWDAFQQDLFEGPASEGLRSLVKSMTEIVSNAQKLFSDGIQIGDFGKIIFDVVDRLRSKFMELDGIGSVLAGGVLMGALTKIASKVRSVTQSIRGLSGGTSSRGGTVSTSQSVGTMTVHAGVVNVNGATSGGRKVGNQSIIDNYNRTKETIRGGGTPPPPTTSRFSGMKSAGIGAGIMAATFGVMDSLSVQEHSKTRLAEANQAVEFHQNQLKEMYKSGASAEQIAQGRQNVRDAQDFVARTQKLNDEDEFRTNAGVAGNVAGSAAGAALGSIVGPVGTIVGGIIGGIIGDSLGQYAADWKIKQGLDKPARTNYFNDEAPQSLKERVYGTTPEAETQRQTARFTAIDQKLGTSSPFQYSATQNAAQDFYRQQRENYMQPKSTAPPESPTIKPTPTSGTFEAQKPAQVQIGYGSATGVELPSIAATPTSGTFETSQPAQVSTGYGSATGVELPEFNVDDLLTSATERLSEFGSSLTENLSSAFDGIGEFFSEIGGSLTENLSGAFDGVSEFFSEIGSSVTENLMTAFDGVSEFFGEFGATVSEGLMTAFDGASEIFTGLGEQISAGLEGAAASAEGALSTISATFDSAREGIVTAWSELPGVFGGIFDGLGGVAASAGSAILSGLTSVCGAVIGAWEGVASTVSGIIASIQAAASSVASMIPSIGGGGVGKAEGGFVSAETHFYAGEHGPEVVIPLSSSRRSRALDLFEKTAQILGGEAVSFGGDEIKSDTDFDKIGEPSDIALTTFENPSPSREKIVASESILPETPVTQTQSSTSSNEISMGGINISFNVSGDDPQEILNTIREHIAEVTDSIATTLNEQIANVHANQPLEA